MADLLSPRNAGDVLTAVREALAAEAPLEIIGTGTKRGWGRPVKSNRVLDLSGLSGIVLYEPDELVLSAKAGTPMAEAAEGAVCAVLVLHRDVNATLGPADVDAP